MVKAISSNLKEQKQEMRILIMTSVAAEKEAVLRGLSSSANVDVLVGGVGPIAAAANTARVLATTTVSYDLVICAGIAGAFPDLAPLGSLVVANEIIAADLGAETAEGFSSLDELGFGTTRISVDSHLVALVTKAIETADVPVQSGPILTLSTVTGSSATALKLAERVPGAMAEAMEGYGVATAAQSMGLPVLEIRAISNLVGPRDREAWRIPEALAALERASSVLMEVFK